MGIVHVLRSSIFLYTILIRLPTIISTISDSKALLKLKESFTNTTALDSWKPGTDPCTKGRMWQGVVCGSSGSALGLRLGSLGLSGKIDVDSLVSLSSLRTISFVSNEFSGPIPSFNKLVALKGLFLSKNRFSGEIPSDYFKRMGGLKKVGLSENKFSGRIPDSLGNLSRLMELHLEYNQFSGTIPALLQPGLVSLNVSNNKLEGEIPEEMLRFGASSFQGNSGLCSGTIGKSCNTTNSDSEKPDSHSKIFIWVILASILSVVMLVVILVLVRKKSKRDWIVQQSSLTASQCRRGDAASAEALVRAASSQRVTRSSLKGSKRISKRVGDIVMLNEEAGGLDMIDLMKAAAAVLGNGVLGCSYKATLASGVVVVVKRIKEMNKVGKDQFDAEVRRLGSLKHKNIIAPLAYHYRQDDKLLVYEYHRKGSLLFVLQGVDPSINNHCPEMTWPVRVKIIQGVARGLAFLHTELPTHELPHGNLKSSNVLLTSEYEALLIDYGFSPLVSSSRAMQGLAAYKSPEAIIHHQISPRCDVFCLGLIIFEIVTGKAPQDNMIQWVRSAIAEGKQTTIFDPNIAAEANTKSSIDEMEKALQVGIACTESNPEQRLDIAEAVKRIESITSEGSSQEIEPDECLYELDIS